jgi:hypothetical protein
MIKLTNYIVIFLLICFIFSIFLYYYESGPCQIKKEYICNNNFCLIKEFNVNLNSNHQKDINNMLQNKSIQKRVTIITYPENILNCALPNKDGVTISTKNIVKYSPSLIDFYQNDLCNIVSKQIGLKLFPTNLDMPTSCAILIYEKENDWINWHYDYNYYNGRFFTVLIPITHHKTCTKFQFKNDNDKIIDVDLTNNAICFEGNFLYHRASKLCKNQKRIILSCQYVTNNTMSYINKLRIKLKDFAYIGGF